MIAACTGMPQGAGFVSSVTTYVDCQAQTLGTGIWSVLSMPGSILMVVLTGLLTIFIALIGYNLLLGTTMTVRSATLSFVKIGAVFALATSWPAYRTLVYDLVVDGPGQLVREVGPAAGVVGSDGTLLQQLDLTDQGLSQLAILGAGNLPANEYHDYPPPPFMGFDAFALGGSRIMFLMTAIAGLAVVRVIAGLMLGLGPFFIAFLLFDGTRGLFEGWIRVLAGAALASIGASIVLGLELALIEPLLSNVIARRSAGEALPTVPTELFVLAALFAILIVATLYACARVARGFRLSPILKLQPASASRHAPQLWASNGPRATDRTREIERTRAAAIANVIASSARRDAALMLSVASSAPPGRTPDVRPSANDGARTSAPLGRSFSRRPNARVSATAIKRDAE